MQAGRTVPRGGEKMEDRRDSHLDNTATRRSSASGSSNKKQGSESRSTTGTRAPVGERNAKKGGGRSGGEEAEKVEREEPYARAHGRR